MRFSPQIRLWIGPAAVVLALGGLALAARQAPTLALINESPSLPRGLYVRSADAEIRNGAIVAIPQPASARAYLASLGMPPDVALIKRVGAVGGDPVCVREGRISTPGGERAVFDHDRRGARLPNWSGCRRLAPHEVFLLGDTAGSFDSRYFGPVDRIVVSGVYREILTW